MQRSYAVTYDVGPGARGWPKFSTISLLPGQQGHAGTPAGLRSQGKLTQDTLNHEARHCMALPIFFLRLTVQGVENEARSLDAGVAECTPPHENLPQERTVRGPQRTGVRVPSFLFCFIILGCRPAKMVSGPTRYQRSLAPRLSLITYRKRSICFILGSRRYSSKG